MMRKSAPSVPLNVKSMGIWGRLGGVADKPQNPLELGLFQKGLVLKKNLRNTF